MARNTRSQFLPDGSYYNSYPIQSSYTPFCPTNIEIDTLSNGFPKQTTIMGPNSLKHLYTGVPNYYPQQTISKPFNSLYGYDTSSYGPHGLRQSYGFMAYPYHHYSPKENHEVADTFIPILKQMDQTKYKTLQDGAWER